MIPLGQFEKITNIIIGIVQGREQVKTPFKNPMGEIDF